MFVFLIKLYLFFQLFVVEFLEMEQEFLFVLIFLTIILQLLLVNNLIQIDFVKYLILK